MILYAYACVPPVYSSHVESASSPTLLGDFLNELSNDGARMQFESFLENQIMPAMVLCAKVRSVGDRTAGQHALHM